ncbi:MAG: hypothetical protein Kow0090_09720 [Myxococcota bacterium]
MKKITLRVKDAKGKVVDHLFTQDSIMIGSGASAHLQLSGEGVSNLHAMIKIEEDGRAIINDLGTDIGTMLNGVTISDEAEIPQGAKIKIGDITIFYLEEAAEEEKKSVGVKEKAVEKKTTSLRKPLESKPAAKSEKLADTGFIDRAVARRKEQPELYKGKAPPPPELGAPQLTPLTDSNKALEVALLWSGAPVEVKHFSAGKKAVTIGSSPKAIFNVPSEVFSQSIYELASPSGGTYSINSSNEMVTTVESEGGAVKTVSGAHLLALSEKVTVKLGASIAFQIRYVPKEKTISPGVFERLDYSMLNSLLTSIVIVIIGVALVVMFAPKMFEAKEDSLSKSVNRFTKLVIKEEKVEEKKIETKVEIKGEKMKNPSNIKDANPNKTKVDRERALNAGILGVLQGGGAVSNVFGAGGLGVGISAALGGLHGTRMGAAGGLGGLGSRGAGAGGGGSAVGIGGIGFGGAGGAYAGGYGAINLGGTGKGETKVHSGAMILKGGLDKDVIAKVVRRHWAQIKYCYEKELAKNPNLFGKITTNWTIGPDGRVQVAQIIQSEMNNVAVEDCIVRNIQRWQFPHPKGGGVVVVTYPFIFKSSG